MATAPLASPEALVNFALPEPKSNKLELFKKTATKIENVPPPKAEAAPQALPVVQAAVQEEQEQEQETEKPVVQEQKVPKTGFVKNALEENRVLKERAAALEAENQRYKAMEETLKTREQELETKLKEGGTATQELHWQEQLNATRKDLEDREQRLQEANDELAFHNIRKVPGFIEKYEKPRDAARQNLLSTLGNDPSKVAELNKALHAHFIALTDPSQGQSQQTVRDETAEVIYEQLSPMQQARFRSLWYDLLTKEEDHVKAIAEHQQTRAQLTQENERNLRDNQSRLFKQWRESSQIHKTRLEEETALPEEITRVLLNNKIDHDITNDLLIAESAWGEGQQFPPEELTRVLNQGAMFPRLKAHTKAQDIIIKELQETINKMNGSGTGKSTPSTPEAPKVAQPKTRDALLSRFYKKA